MKKVAHIELYNIMVQVGVLCKSEFIPKWKWIPVSKRGVPYSSPHYELVNAGERDELVREIKNRFTNNPVAQHSEFVFQRYQKSRRQRAFPKSLDE